MYHQKYLELLRTHIAKKYGTQEKAAEALGLSRVSVNKILAGKMPPNKTILNDTGHTISKTTAYTFHRKQRP